MGGYGKEYKKKNVSHYNKYKATIIIIIFLLSYLDILTWNFRFSFFIFFFRLTVNTQLKKVQTPPYISRKLNKRTVLYIYLYIFERDTYSI